MNASPRWDEFLRRWDWKQGEHVTIAAPTQTGKTVLARDLARKRRNVITFATKRKDPSLDDYVANGWARIDSIRDLRPNMRRAIIWPKPRGTHRDTLLHRKEVFHQAFDRIMRDGGWTVLMDELHYLSSREFLGLDIPIKEIHHMGASQGITAVTLYQRPAFVPRIIYGSATHAFVARTSDRNDLRELSNLSTSAEPAEVRRMIQTLGGHDFLYIPARGNVRDMVRVNTHE